MSRDAMRELKATTEEAARLSRIKGFVSEIYRYALERARSMPSNSYHHPLPKTCSEQGEWYAEPFYVKNMPDILVGLQVLFPGCDVTHTLLSKGTDGKMYDISKLDDKVLPFVNHALDQSYIVIDWS